MTDVKTNTTAIVVIPPPEVCEPIQGIRRKYDKKIDRWMPHINLIYPFRPREVFDAAAPRIAEALREFAPFSVAFRSFRSFSHGYERFTMWLEPEPSEPFVQIQLALHDLFPDCHEVSNFENGFVPHLSVGQARGARFLESRLSELRAFWKPVTFTVGEVALIARPEVGPFEVVRTLPLGGSAPQS